MGCWGPAFNGTWPARGANAPAGGLEGPAELGGLIPAARAAGSPIPESAAATRVGPQAGLGAVGSLLKDLRASYAAGSLTSAEAAALVEELVLVEADGTVWAPGFQSGGWFALRPAGWERAAAPLDPQRFHHALSAEHAQAAFDRLHAVPVPELIAAPWRPVSGYPEALTCPACRALQSGEKETCWNCGQPAPVLVSPAMPGAAPRRGGRRARGPTPLGPGDQVQIGDVRFVVQGPAGRCARCGSPLATGARFCGECGQPVGGAQPDASGDRTVIVQPAAGLAAGAPGPIPVPVPASAQAPKSGRKRLLWVGLGCLALLASLAACGLALSILDRI